MINRILLFVDWFLLPFRDFFQPSYKVEFVEDPEEKHKKNVVYIVGSKLDPWRAEFLCPCGCKEVIILPVDKSTKPRWDFSINDNKECTLSPSVWRTKSCRSHFFLREGKIKWC